MAAANPFLPYGLQLTPPDPSDPDRDEAEEEIIAQRKKKPETVEFAQLPIISFSEWDKLQQITNILFELRMGQFRDSALLCDQMLEDQKIAGDLTTRCNGLLGAPLTVNPARDNSLGRRIANVVEKGWPQFFPASSVADLLRWGLMIGVGVAEILWDTSGDFWAPRLKIWHPQFLWWRWDERRYYIMTADGGMLPLPRSDKHIHSDGKWVIYTPYGYQAGWLRSLVRPLGRPYLGRMWTFRDWYRYDEVHGLPIKKAIVPSNAEKSAKDRFTRQLAQMGNETVIACPQTADSKGYDVDLLEAKADTYEAFRDLIDILDKAISITILGQDSSNRAQGGSLAQAKEHIRDDYRRMDAKTMAEVLYQQVLYWFTQYNFGNAKLTPEPVWDVEPAEDEKQQGEFYQRLAQALPNLMAAGADVRGILEYFGIPVVDADAPLPGAPAFPNPTPGSGPFGRSAAPTSPTPAAPSQDDNLAPPTSPSAPGNQPNQQTSLRDDVQRKTFRGLDVCIENPANSVRYWYDPQSTGGEPIGMTTMLFDYGYIEGYLSGDGEDLDVYLGPNPATPEVYVVHQKLAPDFKKHDEDKVFLGFPSADSAKQAFLAHRKPEEGEAAFGGMSCIPWDAWLRKLKRRSPDSTSKIRASEQLEQAVALTQRMGSPAMRSAAGQKRALSYQARLHAKAKRIATAALDENLAEVLKEIAGAQDFNDLRQRLRERFHNMNPKQLAEVIKSVRVMAHLDGRYQVQKLVDGGGE